MSQGEALELSINAGYQVASLKIRICRQRRSKSGTGMPLTW
jgi:hypothetical protein